MVYINYETALRLVNDEIENEGSDYVYNNGDENLSCVNVVLDEDGEIIGCCLIGRALMAAGVDPEYLMSRKTDSIHSIVSNGGVRITEKAFRLFSTAQVLQDQGTPWGMAVQRGIETASDYSDVEVN